MENIAPGEHLAATSWRLVYKDEHLLVVEKPTGMLAVPGRGPELQDCLSAQVQAVIPGALVVHRLDRDTSGLMLMACHPDAQRALSQLFAARTVEKRYEAIVHGRPDAAAGEIDLPLQKDFTRPPRHKVDSQGRAAYTRWSLIELLGDRSRLELLPTTGRSHQLRVHLATVGHPILGDNLYADLAARGMADRLLLHATGLTLSHPVTGAVMRWCSRCPF